MEYNYYNVLYTNFILCAIVKKQKRTCGVKVSDNKNSLELASFDKEVRMYIYIFLLYTLYNFRITGGPRVP